MNSDWAAGSSSDDANVPVRPLIQAGTLALWLGCVAIGVVGILIPYPRFHLSAREPPPVVVETVNVELAQDALPELGPAPAAPDTAEPPPPNVAMPPAAPPPTPVAAPIPMIELAIPVEGPTRIVDAKQAAPTPRRQTAAASVSTDTPHQVASLRHLTFGVGEGQQPAPDYPREAVVERQQGIVSIRFTVGEDGKVMSAEVVKPSRWPLLNQAALRAVLEHWRFDRGSVRYFDVPIEFQLNEQ